MKRVELERERDGGDSFLGMVDSSIRQQYRAVFCALKQTRRCRKPTVHMDSGLPFDSPLEVFGGEVLALVAGRGGARGMGGASTVVFLVFGCWIHCFTLELFVVLSFCYFIMFLDIETYSAH